MSYSPPRTPTLPPDLRGGFTLVELLIVVAIIVAMMALVGPAVTAIKGGQDITTAAYDVSGAIQTARSYATANNTYTWIGFYEEDPTRGTGVSGTGRVVISMVSSKDGTQIYTSGTGPSTNIDPTRLSQINKLIKVNNLHLKTAPSTKDPVFPIGQGGGDTFLLRPAVSGTAEQIGDTSPGPSLTPFQFPVSGTNPAIYTFTKVIQFSPRGEARMNNTSYNLEPLIEIGLEAAHGNMVNTTGSNVVALQVTGLAGNVTIYRR